MTIDNIENYLQKYKRTLLDDIVPFWLNNSQDNEYGGFFTCLDREGKVYDTDKFVWLQCRQVWCFAMLYNEVESREEWLDCALLGADFLLNNAVDEQGNWYFSLTREGTPLIHPYNIFSDCFAAMAFAQLFKATGKQEYASVALNTFNKILARKENSKGKYNKVILGVRDLKSFSLPMILSNLVLEVEHLLDNSVVEETLRTTIDTVLNDFYQPEESIILENVGLEGEFVDCFEGRLVNPGHGMEAMWFLMDIGVRNNDLQLIEKAKDISLSLLSYGWDEKYGGIFYFRDIKDKSPLQLEWDQKLWWVHMETLVCLLKGYLHTDDKRCWEWFEKVHDYSWKHFSDPSYGEWFGYLNRQGEPLLSLKGGKWKGCFHVPRGMFQCWKTLEKIIEKNQL